MTLQRWVQECAGGALVQYVKCSAAGNLRPSLRPNLVLAKTGQNAEEADGRGAEGDVGIEAVAEKHGRLGRLRIPDRGRQHSD